MVPAWTCLSPRISAGPALKTALVGLLEDVSLESALRLAEMTYTRVVDTAGLNDHRLGDQKIDTLLRLQPDVVIITGGTDGGASRSVHKMLEPVGLAGYLLPQEKRPAVLFAGNQKLDDEVKGLLGGVTSSLHFSPNVRPSLETEDLEPAAHELVDIFLEIRQRQMKGLDSIASWAEGNVLPAAYALNRLVRFLGQVYPGHKGLLSVDIGASAAVIAAGFRTKINVERLSAVWPRGEFARLIAIYQPGRRFAMVAAGCFHRCSTRLYLPEGFISSLHPGHQGRTGDCAGSNPSGALSCRADGQAQFSAARCMRRVPACCPGLNRSWQVADTLDDATTPGQSLLLLLDAVQPTGLTTIILDKNDLLPLLGAAAKRTSILPVQVLKSGAFQSLGTMRLCNSFCRIWLAGGASFAWFTMIIMKRKSRSNMAVLKYCRWQTVNRPN